MKDFTISRRKTILSLTALLLFAATRLHAQTCLTADDMDQATKTALINTAQSYYDSVARGDSATLQKNAIASLAGSFSDVETAVKDNQSNLSSAKPIPRSPFLFQAEGNALLERAEFLCGVFGPNGQTANSQVFVIPNLPPGNYGFVIQDVNTAKGSYTVSYVLEQQGTVWKLGGLYIKPAEVEGHDGNWFATQGRKSRRLVLLSTSSRTAGARVLYEHNHHGQTVRRITGGKANRPAAFRSAGKWEDL